MAADSLDSAFGLLGHLPEGSLVIIKDSLHASGSFLLHHYLSKLLSTSKAGNETRAAGAATNVRTLELANDSAQAEGLSKAACRVCLVAFDQTFSHYASVGRKLGTNLNAKLDEGALCFIDCVSKPYERRSNTPSKIKALVNEVLGGLNNSALKPNVHPVKEAPSASAPSDKPKPGTLQVTSQGAPSKNAQMLSSSSRKQSSQTVAPSPLTYTCPLTISDVSGARSPLQSLIDQLGASVQTFRRSEAGHEQGVTIIFDDLGGPEAACRGSASDVLALLNCSRRLRSQSGQVRLAGTVQRIQRTSIHLLVFTPAPPLNPSLLLLLRLNAREVLGKGGAPRSDGALSPDLVTVCQHIFRLRYPVRMDRQVLVHIELKFVKQNRAPQICKHDVEMLYKARTSPITILLIGSFRAATRYCFLSLHLSH
jgi:hypothetical protein